MTTKETLIAARKKIEQGWCQGIYEKDGQYCMSGALDATSDDFHVVRASEALADVVGCYPLSDWNDRPGRTQAEVLAAFDKAIEACR